MITGDLRDGLPQRRGLSKHKRIPDPRGRREGEAARRPHTPALGGLIRWAALSGAAIAGAIHRAFVACFGAHAPLFAPGLASRAAVTVILFLAYEFGYWIDHALKRRVPALWELHKPRFC